MARDEDDSLGSGWISRQPTTNIIHFGSPAGSQFSRPKSPLIITSRMPEDDDSDTPFNR